MPTVNAFRQSSCFLKMKRDREILIMALHHCSCVCALRDLRREDMLRTVRQRNKTAFGLKWASPAQMENSAASLCYNTAYGSDLRMKIFYSG